ncbi:MAG: hypothetical protein GY903_28475 [Fuerstiella sp.]|nr:hypothetical protein [Fuerstiella sp.]MCP4858430.1 hypothetical protein [Fuerstiella sp.]
MTWIVCLLALLAFCLTVAVVTMIVRQMSKRNGGAATAIGVLATICFLLMPGMLVLWLVLTTSPAPRIGQNDQLATRVNAVVSSVQEIQQDVSRMAPFPPRAPFAPEGHISPFESPPTVPAPLPDLPRVALNLEGMEANAHSMLEHAKLTVWANTDLQQFTANAYPGVLEAVKPLARKVRDTIDANQLLAEANDDESVPIAGIDINGDVEVHPEVAPAESTESISAAEVPETAAAIVVAEAEDTAPLQVIVAGQQLPERYRDSVLQRFTEQIRFEFRDGKVSISDGTESKLEDGTVILTLSLEDERSEKAPWDYSVQQLSGRHRCDIVTSKGTATATSSYIQKPWVEALDVFISVRPERQFVVGYSQEFVSSAVAARHLAMKDARSKSRVAVGGGAFATADESHVIDRFAQKLSRPYGDVWREAVLLDVSGGRMAQAIAVARRKTVYVEERQVSVAVSLLVLFGVTMVLCVILNLLTQGYYRKRLLMTGGIAVGIMLLLFLGAAW